jgi:hypothetical protein
VTDSAWEAIFMLVVLKIPLIYLGVVVWWAVRAEPLVEGGADEAPVLRPLTPCGWDDWKRRRPTRAGRRPIRPVRPSLPARARA